MKPDTAKTIGIIVVLVAVLGAVGLILWPILKGLRDLSDGLGGIGKGLGEDLKEVLDDAGRATTAVTGAAADVVENSVGVGEAGLEPFRRLIDTLRVSDVGSAFQPGAQSMVLKMEDTGSRTTRGLFGALGRKYNVYRATVTLSDGTPVEGATIATVLGHQLLGWTSTNIDPARTGPDGTAEVNFWVRDLAGTASEDDARHIATHSLYNDSNVVKTY